MKPDNNMEDHRMDVKYSIFDTHAHYDDEAFDADREEILAKLQTCGIGRVVDPASTLESVDRVKELADQYPFLYGALGIHPEECVPMTEEHFEDIRAKLHDPKIVAVGEIGLDYHWDTVPRTLQQHWFRRQIELALEEEKPIIVHSRDAAADTLSIVRELNVGAKTGGVIHCFSYSVEVAREFMKMGFYLGVGGVVTFKNARKLKEVVKDAPLERIVLETDSPYMAPVPHRGERNSSLYLPFVIDAIAELKQISGEEVVRQTEINAEQLYHLR